MDEFGWMQDCYFGVDTLCEQEYSQNTVKLTYIGNADANEDPYRGLDRGTCPVLAGNPLGNWDNFKQDDNGNGSWDLNQTRDHTKANEIEKIDAASSVISHDPAGNLTKSPRPGNWSGTFDYTWDAWNRLVAVTARGTNIAFAYDGQHKRITKTASGITRHYYYSVDWQILEERLDEETEPLRQYVWNPNPDSMDDLILRDEGVQGSGSSSSGGLERLYALNDLMNVTAIADDDGSVQERYGYDPFGESRVMDASFNSRTSSNYDWEFRYKTYPLDLESGLYQVRYRYLHPGLGRWMSRDPIGYHGGLNLYRFVGNDPVNRWDYLGLTDCDDFIGSPEFNALPPLAKAAILAACGGGQIICPDGCKPEPPPPLPERPNPIPGPVSPPGGGGPGGGGPGGGGPGGGGFWENVGGVIKEIFPYIGARNPISPSTAEAPAKIVPILAIEQAKRAWIACEECPPDDDPDCIKALQAYEDAKRKAKEHVD